MRRREPTSDTPPRSAILQPHAPFFALTENDKGMRGWPSGSRHIPLDAREHPFGTLKMRMGATHFLTKTLPKVATEMALHVLAYNLTRVMNIVGIKPLLAAIRA
jgi:hypothetical protein